MIIRWWLWSLFSLLNKITAFPSPTISFVIDVQGCPNNVSYYHPTLKDVKNYTTYWNDPKVKGGAAWFFDVCTMSNPLYALHPASDHPVFSKIVPVPCVGMTPYSKMPYNAGEKCGFMELYAYQEIAAASYFKSTGRNITANRRIIVNVPDNCKFYGAGSQGCSKSYCYVWVRSDRSFYWTIPGRTSPLMQTVIHELGHTLDLQHSANVGGVPRPESKFWAYGDSSCVMGSVNSAGTCYNAPQARRLGYIKPVVDINVTDMAPEVWRSYVLPLYTTSPINHITMRSDSVPLTIFLSLRSKNAGINGADGDLNTDFSNVVSVHVQNIDLTMKPMIIALVPLGSTYNINASASMDNDYGGYGLTQSQRQTTEMMFRNIKNILRIRFVSLYKNKSGIVSISRVPY